MASVVGTFERLVRWAYPGLLLAALLPLAHPSLFYQWQALSDRVFVAGVALIAASASLYMFQRYVVHDVLEQTILGKLGFTAFSARQRKLPILEGLVVRWVDQLCIRFSDRRDGLELSNYLMSRWGNIHAMGLTGWLLPVMYLLADYGSPLSGVSGWAVWLTAAAFLVGHYWQAILTERMERKAYPLDDPPGSKASTC